jgi:hypothetical protein
MDTAAFIVALAVFVVIGFWYVENELKRSDGAHGLLAVRAAEKPKKSRLPRFAEGVDAPRYRPRGAGEAAPPPADPANAGDLGAGAGPKYRRKERAWDRALKLDEEPGAAS